MPLYAAQQTTLYRPPPVVNGRIPKNVYGNLDIYVSSMVPAGGSHIMHPETARAARVLGIDYAQAVTGFDFKGRHGTAVINGAVVASECCQAVNEVIEGFDDEKAQEEEVRKSVEALRAWKRLLTGLRVRERIDGYEIEGERKLADEGTDRITDKEDESDDDEEEEEGEEEDEDEDDYDVDEVAGGFFPDRIGANAEQTAASLDRYLGEDDEVGGGFIAEDSLEDGGGGFEKADGHSSRGFYVEKDVQNYDQEARGGFMIDDVLDKNDDQSQGIRPTINRFGTNGIEDQSQLVHEARPQQNHPPGVREHETPSLPVEESLSDDSTEPFTDRKEDSTLLNENNRGGLGGFSAAAIHAAAAVIPSADSHYTGTTLEEEEEHKITAKAGTTMQLTATQLHSEGKPSNHLSEPAAVNFNSTKSRNEGSSVKALTPIQLSTSSLNVPPPPSVDQDPPSPPSRDNNESSIPSQPTVTAAAAQEYNNAAGSSEGGAGNESSDDEDAESLLSQDPEDVDADPEWLA